MAAAGESPSCAAVAGAAGRASGTLMQRTRQLLSDVTRRVASGSGQELLCWDELSEYVAVLTVDPAQESARLAHLRGQVTTLLHQHFRGRWPHGSADWTAEETECGLDRPTGNRTHPCAALDLSSVGVTYINAAAIAGLAPSRLSYVATQHPLPRTVGDFWRMVLHVRPAAIVMLNGLIPPREAADFPEYWLPESLPPGGPSVSPLEEAACDGPAGCTVRRLRCSLGDREWRGPQLSVSWWRDQDEPPMDRFLALERLVNSFVVRHEEDKPSVVVHCAGGIGRAGVFIAADCAARAVAMGLEPSSCSPDQLVGYLRGCRMNMVQTAEQYDFLHRVLPPLAAQLAAELAPQQQGCVGPPGSPSPARSASPPA